jgi:transcriptional regulator with XRE-family HTH domain
MTTSPAPNQKLRTWREDHGLSRAQMAKALTATPTAWHDHILCCSPGLIARWESGRIRWPSRKYQAALHDLTGQPPASLGFTPPPPTPTDMAALDDLTTLAAELHQLGHTTRLTTSPPHLILHFPGVDCPQHIHAGIARDRGWFCWQSSCFGPPPAPFSRRTAPIRRTAGRAASILHFSPSPTMTTAMTPPPGSQRPAWLGCAPSWQSGRAAHDPRLTSRPRGRAYLLASVLVLAARPRRPGGGAPGIAAGSSPLLAPRRRFTLVPYVASVARAVAACKRCGSRRCLDGQQLAGNGFPGYDPGGRMTATAGEGLITPFPPPLASGSCDGGLMSGGMQKLPVRVAPGGRSRLSGWPLRGDRSNDPSLSCACEPYLLHYARNVLLAWAGITESVLPIFTH